MILHKQISKLLASILIYCTHQLHNFYLCLRAVLCSQLAVLFSQCIYQPEIQCNLISYFNLPPGNHIYHNHIPQHLLLRGSVPFYLTFKYSFTLCQHDQTECAFFFFLPPSLHPDVSFIALFYWFSIFYLHGWKDKNSEDSQFNLPHV